MFFVTRISDEFNSISRQKKAGQNHDIKMENGSFENVHFEHYKMTITDENLI
jgi:hypothetical protein